MDFKLETKNGFTLIELIIYVAVFSIVASGIVAYLSTTINTKLTIDTQHNLTMQGRSIMGTITKEVRDSYAFRIEDGGTKVVLDKNLGGTDQTTIYLTNNKVVIEREFGIPVSLNDNTIGVKNLTFTNYTSIKSDNLLHISLEISNPGTTNSPYLQGDYELSTSVNLRNGLEN